MALPNCNAFRITSLVKDTVSKFEQSADEQITAKHVPTKKIEECIRANKTEFELTDKILIDIALVYAEKLWQERIDLKSKVMCSHDTYLKLYQLSKPQLDFDCIIGDEFQDVNPVVADIILRQPTQKVLIGDPNQSIYGWRGARNYLKDSPEYERLYLSKSFRYGPEIAELAMTVIKYQRHLEGFEERSTNIGHVDTTKPYTKIFRTNSCLLTEAVELISEGVAVSVDINTKDFVNKIYNVISLKNGDKYKVKHKDIIIFEDYMELLAEAEYDPELNRIVKIVESDNTYDFIRSLKTYKKPRNPHALFTTGHKAKGLEWDNVIMADDFPLPRNDQGEYAELAQGEVNLLYVCLTRAQKNLQINTSIAMIRDERNSVKSEFPTEFE